MAKTLTETLIYPTTVTVPVNGDPRTAVSVEGAFQTLTNRTAYLKSISDARYNSGSAMPEGAVSAEPGTCYYESDAEQVYLKASGVGNTGWHRVLSQAADSHIYELYDRRSGSDGDRAAFIVKISASGGDRNYLELYATSDLPVSPAALVVHGADDSTYPGQAWLRPATNSADRVVVDTDGSFWPNNAADLGTDDKRWGAIKGASINVTTTVSGAALVASGAVQAASGSITGNLAVGNAIECIGMTTQSLTGPDATIAVNKSLGVTGGVTASGAVTAGGNVTAAGDVIGTAITPEAFTVSELPAAPAGYVGRLVYVTNGNSGSHCLAFGSLGAWRRIVLGAAVSES